MGGLFSGVFGVEVERGRFQRFDEVWQTLLRLIRAHRFLLPPVPHLLLRLKVSIPGVVGVTIKVIVVHGELREMFVILGSLTAFDLAYYTGEEFLKGTVTSTLRGVFDSDRYNESSSER